MNNVQKFFANATWRRRSASLAGLLALSLLSGCASMLGSVTEPLPIASTPPDAQILIIDEAGRTTYRGRTPDTVALPKSNGRYWGGKKYEVAISKRGYRTQRVTVDTHPNALYLGGNLIFGGVIGWFIVDPTSSKMYGLSSEGIDVTLQKTSDEAQSGAVVPSAPLSERPIAGDAIAPAPGADDTPAPSSQPAPAPLVPPAEPKPPRPYWPAPPPLPVEPSSALPAALPLA